MKSEQKDQIWTVGRIAAHHKVGRHRVEYVIDARNIRPIGTAGIARIFSPTDVDLIREELSRIEAQRRRVAYEN